MILKYNDGGIFGTFTLLDYSDSPISKSSKKTKEINQDEEDIMDILKMFKSEMIDNALPGDLLYATDSLINLFKNIELKLKYSTLSTSSIVSEYMKCINIINRLKVDKEDYIKARDTAIQKDTLNEMVINSQGFALVQNEDGFDWKNPELILESDVIITNQLLLNYRRIGIFNNKGYLDVIMGSVGYNQIIDSINKTIQGLGKTSVQEGNYTLSKELIQGINDFIQAKESSLQYNASLGDLYEGSILTENQVQQMNQSLTWLWRTLPNNVRSMLKIKSGEYTEDGGFKLLSLLVGSKTSTINKLTGLNKEKSSSSKSSSKDDEELTLGLMFLADMGSEVQLSIRPGSQSGLKLNATMLPNLDKSGNPLGVTTLDKVINNTVFHPFLMTNLITMGNQILDMSGLSKVIVNGNQIYKVYLPYDLEYASRGIIKPNLTYLQVLDLVKLKIRDTNATTPEEINAIYTEYKLPKFIDENGNVDMRYYKPFAVMNATALSDAFGDKINSLDNIHLTEMLDKQDILNNFEKIYGIDTKREFDDKGLLNYLGIGKYQRMVKGLVYIPVVVDLILGLVGGGASYGQIDDLKLKLEQALRVNTIRLSGQL